MKKWLCLVLVGLMLLCCTACDGEPDTSVNAGGDVSTATTTTSTNKTDGTTMTDDEAIAICLQMVQTTHRIHIWFTYFVDEIGSETLPAGTVVKTLAGEDYVLDAEYYIFADTWMERDVRTAKDLKAIIESVYTDDMARTYFEQHRFVEYQGRLYAQGADGVVNETLDASRMSLVKKEKDAITFRIAVYGTDIFEEYTAKYIDGGWRFDEYVY